MVIFDVELGISVALIDTEGAAVTLAAKLGIAVPFMDRDGARVV